MIADGKRKFYDAEANKLTGQHMTKIPFKILKNLTEAERPAAWDVTMMRPGKTERDVAEELADFFIRITSEYQPISTIPETYESPFKRMMPHKVAAAIRDQKTQVNVARRCPPIPSKL